jgi:hypothetical protein
LALGITITDADIERVKQIDLSWFCEHHLGCVRRGSPATIAYLSPFREEKEPSFTVRYYKGRWEWKDWGTGEAGDIIDLIQKCYKTDFVGAMTILLTEEFPDEMYRKQQAAEEEDKAKKMDYARRTYLKSLKCNSIEVVRKYFADKGVQYHYPMNCAIVTSFKEHKSFVAIPIPNPEHVRGLECRERNGAERKTLGVKTLWFFKRNPGKLLVTESVLDALAGEVVLDDKDISLCSANGVGNIEKLADLLKQHPFGKVYLALDNDAPGRKAEESAATIVRSAGARAIPVEDHIRAGAKDLHRLLISATNTERAVLDETK